MKKSFYIVICVLIVLIVGVTSYVMTPGLLNIFKTSTTPTNSTNTETNVVVPLGKLKLSDNSTIYIPRLILEIESETKLPSNIFRDIAGGDKFDYHISYLPYNKENSQIEFHIILNTIPLSKTRLEAENILRTKLELSNEELCKMDISVYVFGWVSEKYAGQNLNLSFCDSAIILP